MSPVKLRIIITGIFFLIIFLSGNRLTKSGKPHKVIVLTIHKLVSLGAVVFLVITIRRITQLSPLSAVELTALVVTGLFFLGTMITGAMLSIGKPMTKIILKLHQTTPYLTVLSIVITLYLLTCCQL